MSAVKWAPMDLLSNERGRYCTTPVLTLDDLEAWLKECHGAISTIAQYDRYSELPIPIREVIQGAIDAIFEDLLRQMQEWKSGD